MSLFHQYYERLINLPEIKYHNIIINYRSINYFLESARRKNDNNNNMREYIIGAIINKKIPEEYFKYSNRWRKLNIEINRFIDLLINKYDIITIEDIFLEHKGGRRHNYDFMLVINGIQFKLEFKFNVSKLSQAPQFVSPMKPSNYLSNSYEEFYYDNYLNQLAEFSGLPIPNRDTYLKKVHQSKPVCILDFQNLYYSGCKRSSQYTEEANSINFYNKANVLDKESRKKFIENNELNIEKLSNYLLSNQPHKIYMLYHKNKLYLEETDINEFKLISYIKKPNLYKYIVKTETEKEIHVLLRWKNGNGIAFPAFQIS